MPPGPDLGAAEAPWCSSRISEDCSFLPRCGSHRELVAHCHSIRPAAKILPAPERRDQGRSTRRTADGPPGHVTVLDHHEDQEVNRQRRRALGARPTRRSGLAGLRKHRSRCCARRTGLEGRGRRRLPGPARARGRSFHGRARRPAGAGDERRPARGGGRPSSCGRSCPRCGRSASPAGGHAVRRRRSVVHPAGPGRHPDARGRPLGHARQTSHDCGSVK